jgi:hypothetical protein
MQKTVLNEIFELLQQIGAVSSGSEFSRDWPTRSECFMCTLCFKQAKLAICASKLQHYANCMAAADANAKISNQFIKLSERCHTQINSKSEAVWLDEMRI